MPIDPTRKRFEIAAIILTWLALVALLAWPSFARAQCSSGSCSSGVQRLPANLPRPQFALTLATEREPMYGHEDDTEPTHDPAAMAARGWKETVDPVTGQRQWRRIVATDGKAVPQVAAAEVTTQTGCSNGSCGLFGNRHPAKTPDWNAAPRSDRPPLATTPPAAPPVKPADPPPVTAQPIDLDKLASILVDKLAADARFKGPKGDVGIAGRDGIDGKPGPAGPSGPSGRDGKDADESRIVAAILAKIDYDAIASRVKVPTPTVPVSSPASRHWVLVANQDAAYWPRLSGELAHAREVYSSIDLVHDPGNVGVMPQLVLYEGSTPLQVFKGQYEVSGQLALIARN